MRITKLLGLATVAGVAVACNGISPTEPTATVASDEATALVGAKAMKGPVYDCRRITDVNLRLLRPTEKRYASVEAVYLNNGLPAGCQEGPNWFSRPRDRVIQTRDPFIVRVLLTRPPSPVEVTAVAPNGVQASIRVQ